MQYSHRIWVCPFFKWDTRKEIICEVGNLRFPNRKELNAYAREFCGSYGWEKCSLAEMLVRYYEEKNKQEGG